MFLLSFDKVRSAYAVVIQIVAIISRIFDNSIDEIDGDCYVSKTFIIWTICFKSSISNISSNSVFNLDLSNMK